ncbi:aminotransferase class I/II-fold pyridoxal phosphate-dependent enzyme [Roseiarcus sp.]|jgi:methionine-gamma-lyase|uniref:aminotransferase class I/II-fold pyridoxal phosphate-dependent enzyme n=1 Tax=Roseiarcus sp. TaxID=1969460 RepID=UPI003D142D4F
MPPLDRKRRNAQLGFSTRAIHLGYDPGSEQGALTPPIFMTSTYAFESAEAGSEMFRGERPGYIYGRTRNPTQALLEERIASLEGGEAGLALASGIGALSSTLWTLVSAGDEVVIDHILYGNTFAFFTRGLTRFGVSVRVADLSDPASLERVLTRKTKIVYFETPANPNLRVIDIAQVSSIAKAVGAMPIVDNTFATPALQRPLEHGASLVLHSATKYLGGHGDLLGGMVVGPVETIERIRGAGLRVLTGATLSPFNAFLILRGLKTLDMRMERHSRSAQRIAETLSEHPSVTWVSYPGLATFPQYSLARRQMDRPGGLIAFELAGGARTGMAFMNSLELVTRAVSLGDAETLVQHPATMTHATYSPAERKTHGISDDLLRLSVGLEDPEDIIHDIIQALDVAAHAAR